MSFQDVVGGETVVTIGLGMYPNQDVMEGFACVAIGGREPTDVNSLETRLRAWLAAQLGAPGAAVHDLRRLSGGSARENWAFSIVTPM